MYSDVCRGFWKWQILKLKTILEYFKNFTLAVEHVSTILHRTLSSLKLSFLSRYKVTLI